MSKIEEVHILFVDHKDQRYNTPGDWQIENKILTITASRVEDPRSSFAVAFHEFVEAILCTQRGVTPEQVDEFDMGKGMDYEDPGKSPAAPYHMEHMTAEALERKFTDTLGLDWKTHNETIDNL